MGHIHQLLRLGSVGFSPNAQLRMCGLARANGKDYWVVILLSSLLPHRHSPRMHPLKRAGPGAERAADRSSGSRRDCQSLSFHCPGHDHGLCPISPSSACHSKKIGEVLICLGINIIVFAVRHLASREDRFCWGHVSASNHLTFPSRSIRRIAG